MLTESFFQAQCDCKEDISMHVAKLQQLFVDLSDELAKHSENTVSERMLTGWILSTLGKEYDNFKDAWDPIPISPQTVNLLIGKLCEIELWADKLASAEATALVAHENDKKKSNSMKVNSSKSIKRWADRTKQKFPCNKCKKLGHWAAECPQKKQHAGDKGGESAAKKTADVFPVHVMGASRASIVDTDSWYCQSGASRHIALNKHYFVSHTKFANPETIVLGKKNVLIQEYSWGMTNIQMFHNGMWHDTTLKNVWYLPDASAHLFFVKTAA